MKIRFAKVAVFFAANFATAFSSFADFTNSPENFSPHFSTNTEIIWQAPTKDLPKSFWIYKRLPPKPFSATVISNAIVLASLQSKGFPKPSTNDFFIWEDKGPNYPGPIPEIFGITPKSGTISHWLPSAGTNMEDVSADYILVQRTWACAAQLGVDFTQLAFKEMTSHFNQDESSDDLTNKLCGRGVLLSRKLDGILFWSMGTEDESVDGFWIEFGSHGQVRAFSLVWPDLKQTELQQIATPQQIIACIKAQKTIVIPNRNEETYFQRIKTLATAKKFIIKKITPYYMEGRFGETPTNDMPPEIIEPIADLEAVADFGGSNLTVRLISPIISSEVNRLINAK
jgi:hypothetical protein